MRRVLAFLALAAAAQGCGTGGTGKPAPAVKVAVLPAAKPEARPLFEEGLRLMQQPATLEKARDEYTRAVELDGKLFEAWHDLGVVEARLGRWEAAIKALRRALDLQPASKVTLVALGEALTRAGRWRDAQSLYAERLASVPADAGLRLRYVQALRDGGKPADALEEVKRLLAKDSRSAANFNALGLVYLKTEKLPLAESAFRRAIELDPAGKAAAPVWNNLGLVALARGRDQDAFQAFEKAASLDGKYREAHLNQALVYLDCGDYKRAERGLRRAIEIEPDDPEAHVTLGVALRGQKRFDDARAAYEKALALRPEHPAALYNLGVLYMDFQDDKPKAREALSRYRKLAMPDDPKRADAAARLKELK